MPEQKTLIEIAQSRPDVLSTAQSQGGDPFAIGTKANTWLNDWWNSTGESELLKHGITLKQPLDALALSRQAAEEATSKLGLGGNIGLGDTSNQAIQQNGPSVLPDTSSITASASSIVATTPTEKALQAEIARIEAQRTAEASSLKSLMGAQPKSLSMQEITSQALTALGLPADFTKTQFQSLQQGATEIETLTKSLAAVETREQQALSNIEGQAIPMENITSQQAQTKRNFAIEKAGISANISAKAAYMQALQGNFQLVTQMVDKAVSYATHEQDQKIADFKWMFSQYKDEFDSLTKREQDLFDNLLIANQNEATAIKADLRDKINLYLQSGLAIPDMETLKKQSFEEAATYVSQNANLTKPATTSIVNVNGRSLLINDLTGETIKDLGVANSELNQDGSNQPVSSLFTKQQIAQMSTGGLSAEDATDIYTLIQNGTTLEAIRDLLRQDGKSISLLDVFDRTIGIAKILGEE